MNWRLVSRLAWRDLQVWRDSSLGRRVDGRSGYGHFNKPFRRPVKAGTDLRVGDIPCRGSTDSGSRKFRENS